MSAQISVDTGGTHTDLVLLDAGQSIFRTLKVPTTPEDLSIGILDGVEKILNEAQLSHADVERFIYGTTLVTNIIVEQKDVDVGLITTHGFRDVLAIGRASRKPNIYDIHWRPNPALVARRHRMTVTERINAKGEVVEPLDDASAVHALEALAAAGITSVAVCLLHSYANPQHEQAIQKIAGERFPQLRISLSSDIVREFREFERSSTTAINAYVKKPMEAHLDGLAARLRERGLTCTPYIMRGNGGIISFDMGKQFPVAITHSGPVAGIIGAAMLAKAAGFPDIITFDMGGTSSDICLIAKGEPEVTTRGKLAGYPILLPVIDLVTIGAGGGSIARVDTGGALRVGPRSAGSVPGPMCYGQGGNDPTITDANIFTGRLNPDYFLAGARKIFPDLAQQGLRERVASPLKLSAEKAALGILEIAESHMVNAIKLVSVQRGLDPRDFTLVGFGGAGPLHAVNLADALGIRNVLIPPAPGNTSACGLMCAEIRQDLVRTVVTSLADADVAAITEAIDALIAAAARVLTEEGIAAADQHVMISADLRYAGQSHELTVPLIGDDLKQAALQPLAQRFAERHKVAFGYDLPDRAVELVNLRVSAFGPTPDIPWPTRGVSVGKPPAPIGTRVVLHPAVTVPTAWPVYRFDALAPGASFQGPAIVEYRGSTLVVPPRWTVRYDHFMNAIVSRD
jgi:N-methylhydantoinase A